MANLKQDTPLINLNEIKSKIIKYDRKIRFIFYSKKNKKLKFSKKDKKIFIIIEDENIFESKVEDKPSAPKVSTKTTPKAKEAKKISNKPKATDEKDYKIVVIDPGHGGKDVGAVGYKKRKEKILVLKISKLLKEELTKRGFIVFLTRKNDVFLDLKERTKIANTYGADIFISIHANSASPFSKDRDKKNGFETYFLSDARSDDAKDVAELENNAYMDKMKYHTKNMFLSLLDREKQIASNKLAIDLQKGVLSRVLERFDVRDGGVREGPFWVLVGTLMPSVLVEVGYMSNKKEADRLFNPTYQKLIIKGLADGIESYFQKNQ